MAHRVEVYPLEKAKRAKLRILNQSALKSQAGPTWKVLRKKNGINRILRETAIIVDLELRFMRGDPPAERPMVSNTLKVVLIIVVYHEALLSQLLMKLKYEAYMTPGNTMKVTRKTKSMAHKRP